ncbi:helix-turn-helix domain-containing protein [Asaia lannensis]|uniref:helix-turn-helix domain-containing protein n=1 Tax=Asaia lannensis TaxID=415421 RepID=UPI00338F779A
MRLREVLDAYASRTGRRMTYEALAAASGISVATLQSLGSRATYNATLATIGKLCRALECTPGDLLEMAPAFSTEGEKNED